MTGNEFLRRINRLGRQRGIPVRFDQRHGRAATEHCTRLLHAMLGQLGLSRNDLDE
jgi:hypothetical protein